MTRVLSWLAALPAALVALATAAHFVTLFHPAAPFTAAGYAITLALYAPAIVLIVLCTFGQAYLVRLARWVNGLAAVWIAVTLMAVFTMILAENHIDLFSGAFLSSVGLTVTLPFVGTAQRVRLRQLIRLGLVALAATYFVASLALPALVLQRAQAFGPTACLFAFNQASWGADEIEGPAIVSLFQRFIAHRGRNYYTGAFRLELLDGEALYHWSMRHLNFVPTENRFLTSIGHQQRCAARLD